MPYFAVDSRLGPERIIAALQGDEKTAGSPDQDGVATVGRYFRHDDGHTVCEMCPRACRLREGQRGVCFVRECRADQIVLASYGRSTGFCIDPIEKKPLFHFLPGTPVLSFGTAGCNLTCRFCQNWETSRARDVERMSDAATPDAIAAAAVRQGCRSVAMTYNDPVVFFEYAVDVADACHRLDVRTVAVTAGYMMPLPRAEFYRHFDAANVDLKAFTERFYRDLCGGDLHSVLDTLVYLREKTGVWLEITTLLIPGENDSDHELDQMTRWLAANLGAEVPVHFSAFHPDFRLLDHPPTPLATLRRARTIALGNGLHHVYIGNVRDNDGASTFCASCGQRLIGREGYDVTAWALTENGACKGCGATCVGRFDGPPGTWGNRRLPVAMLQSP
jgi:pyruvate formate lyase activating enzyme